MIAKCVAILSGGWLTVNDPIFAELTILTSLSAA